MSIKVVSGCEEHGDEMITIVRRLTRDPLESTSASSMVSSVEEIDGLLLFANKHLYGFSKEQIVSDWAMSLSIFVFQKNGGIKYQDISERKAEEFLYVTGETDPTVGKMS